MKEEDFKTSIQINSSVRNRLKKFGQKGEDYNVILERLMDFFEENK